MKRFLTLYFNSGWLPALVYLCLLGGFAIVEISGSKPLAFAAHVLFFGAGLAFLGLVSALIGNLIKKRWSTGVINIFLIFGCGAATLYVFAFLFVASMFGPSEDGFADHLTIPEGIGIADPEPDTSGSLDGGIAKGADELQDGVRKALSVPGGDATEFTPDMPSLRRAATDHAETFRDYIEASPDWHVFSEQGNQFAARRWSYGGEPRDTLHGYISEFGGDAGFQTRCLICLDRRQWSRYSVQHIEEGKKPVKPAMSRGNNLHESRVMIECGGVWVEIFEQSSKPERRVTKATVAALEAEFSQFLSDPEDTLAGARTRSRGLARRLAGDDGQPFRLLIGMQPGIY